MEFVNLVLNYIVVPIIWWAYITDKKITVLETKVYYYDKYHLELKEDINKLFQKIDDLKDEMHNLFNRK